MASRPEKKSSRLRQSESGVYAGDTSWGLQVSPKLQRVGHAARPEPEQSPSPNRDRDRHVDRHRPTHSTCPARP
jgi:hypothetical protein